VLNGITVTAYPEATLTKTWDRVVAGTVKAIINHWRTRELPNLQVRKTALEAFALSKLWYVAQILPLQRYLRELKEAAGNLIWEGRLERLKWEGLQNKEEMGGLGLVDIEARAQALLVKQGVNLK